MSDSGMVEKSSLPSERERFEELAVRFGLSLERDGIVGDYINNETWGAWQVWLTASAGRQELLEALQGLMQEAHAVSKPIHEQSEWSIRARAAIAKHGG